MLGLIGALWGLYLAGFVANHLRVRRQGEHRQRRLRGDRSSEIGMALQFGAVGLGFAWRRPEAAGGWLAAASIALAVASIALNHYALAHLGRQWRLRAVIAEDHELVETGPYGWVRHPVYTAFFGMLVATVLAVTSPGAGALAAALFVAGTEIRIRAEEKLLAERFGRRYRDYCSRVPAWLPPLR